MLSSSRYILDGIIFASIYIKKVGGAMGTLNCDCHANLQRFSVVITLHGSCVWDVDSNHDRAIDFVSLILYFL